MVCRSARNSEWHLYNFQFLEGSNKCRDLDNVSKSPRRLTVAGDDNWLITDICVRLTKRTNTKQSDSENAVIIVLILELKQSLTESGKTIDGKIGQMMTIYDTESKHVIVTLMQKHWTYKCEDSIYKTTR